MQNINKKKLTTILATVVCAAVAISTMVFAAGGPGGAPGGRGGNLGEIEMSESVITVSLENPTIGSLTRTTEFIGKVEPAQSVNVYAETSGKVTNVYFNAGDTVNAGDLLFEMDDSDAQLTYQIAQASYESKVIDADTTLGSSHESTLLSLESSLKSAQQNLNSARLELKEYNDGLEDDLIQAEKYMDNAYTAYKQAETAYNDAKESGADQSVLDSLYQEMGDYEEEYLMYRAQVNDLEDDDDSTLRSLRNSYKNAQTNYETALENYNLVTGDSWEDTQASVDNSLKSAELSLQQSSNELDKYKVYAPISGVIESRNVEEYEMASTTAAAFTISNKNDMSVTFNATSDAATALSIGDSITVTKGGNDYTAIITSIDSKADESSGLFPIEAQIQDNDGTLLSGVTVKVTAATQKAENAVLVSIDDVYYEDGQAYVFTYSGGKAHRTDFETGMSNSETIVAVSGLTTDDYIITTWHPDLKDGADVVLAEGQEDPDAGSTTDAAQTNEATAETSDTAAETAESTQSAAAADDAGSLSESSESINEASPSEG